jgi:zinc transport system substrate-binding protein
MFDTNSDGMINASELEESMNMGDDDDHDDHDGHDDHDDKLVGHAVLEVLAEGDYGFAMPANIEFFIVMAEGGHDDHDDHGDEDGDDHGDEGEHSDEEEGEALSFDPHSWLDPVAFKEQVKLVLATLVTEYPSMDSKFTDNAEEFMATLDSLDEKFTSTFVTGTSCPSNKVAANHNAYSYMAQRYGLEFVTVHGLDPEGEPTAADIIKVVDQINENGITVFFIEEYTSTEAVESIVEQTISDTMPTGVTVKYLYTMEMAPKDSTDNYASLMEKNFENLKDGLQCTA